MPSFLEAAPLKPLETLLCLQVTKASGELRASAGGGGTYYRHTPDGKKALLTGVTLQLLLSVRDRERRASSVPP